MGLTLKSKGSNIELTGGYGMFKRIREVIANAFDEEFGKHYETLGFCCFFKDKIKEWDEKANKILENERFKDKDEDIVDFLFATDCGGKCNYETCGKIYDLIRNVGDIAKLQYTNRPSVKENDFEDFKHLLLDCYLTKSDLTWS